MNFTDGSWFYIFSLDCREHLNQFTILLNQSYGFIPIRDYIIRRVTPRMRRNFAETGPQVI